MHRRIPLVLGSLAALLLAAAVFVLALSSWDRPSLSEEHVRNTVLATIQEEAPASFYITGHVDVTVSSKMSTSHIVLPGMLDWQTGTVEATARVPGRVFYGFDVRNLQAENIEVGADGVIYMAIPELSVYAVEPALEELEVDTQAGWVRLYDREREKRTERQAIQRIQPALHQQGVRHLNQTNQASINTAEALEKLLTPVLEAVGVQDPAFEFQINDRLVMRTGGLSG